MKNLKKIINTIKKRNKENKKICFFLGNTKKLENKSFFFTPVRENQECFFFGAIVYNDNIAKKILKNIDGLVDYIFVDVEKKVKSKNTNLELINIERSAKDCIKKSILNVYKANDLTISSAETLIGNLFLKDRRGVGGKKILILGVGNIGFKLSLKLVESGANVYLYRRNQKILFDLTKTINLIKPSGTKSKAINLKKFPNDLSKFNLIVTAVNKIDLIKLHQIEKITKKTILIDAGKGNFTQKAINFLRKKKHFIYRLDTTSSYFSYIQNIIFTQDQYKKNSMINKYGPLNLVTQGIVGIKDDLIVDDVENPKKIYGLCDSNGNLKKLTEEKKNKILKNINN